MEERNRIYNDAVALYRFRILRQFDAESPFREHLLNPETVAVTYRNRIVKL